MDIVLISRSIQNTILVIISLTGLPSWLEKSIIFHRGGISEALLDLQHISFKVIDLGVNVNRSWINSMSCIIYAGLISTAILAHLCFGDIGKERVTHWLLAKSLNKISFSENAADSIHGNLRRSCITDQFCHGLGSEIWCHCLWESIYPTW